MFFSKNHSHVSKACDGTRAVEDRHDGEEGRAERDMTETKKDMVVEVRRSLEKPHKDQTSNKDRRNRQTRTGRPDSQHHSHVSKACDGTRAVEDRRDGEEGWADK